MVKICPISDKRMNENTSRLNAVFTFLLSVGFLLTAHPVFVLLLVIDFSLRNIYEGRFNPIVRFNRYLTVSLHLPAHMINAGPKIFAARIGLGLAVLSGLFLLVGGMMAATVFISVLAFFSFLEASFNFCVACKLYPFVLPLNEKVDRWTAG
mgnify:CR=1 FL=1